jgi:hypothetical protein
MLKKLLELFQAQVFLARDVQENKENIAKLRQEFDELAELVRRVQFDIQSVRDEDRHEREKGLLKIENALLKFERQLPAAKGTKKSK